MLALKPYWENPPYGILGRTMETSASFEARSAPSFYPAASAEYLGRSLNSNSL